MRLLHLSDTHSKHRHLHDLPAADIIIHSGDVSWTGKPEEVLDFIQWFRDLNYKYKLFIAGNHDFCLEGKRRETIQRYLPKNCFYLFDSSITIEGLKFWGIPYFISDELRGNFRQIVELIPSDTDVLVTHRPPFGILDSDSRNTYGCPDLLEAVMKLSPRYHLFGHIHNAYGIQKTDGITFVNASLLNEEYQHTNEPVLLDV